MATQSTTTNRTSTSTRARKAARRAMIKRVVHLGTAGLSLVLGAAVSVAANVISADDQPYARIVAAWPSLALLLAIHMIMNGRRSWLTTAALVIIASVAGWVSYWHIHDVVIMAGESAFTAKIMPVTVDALMFVATAVLTAREAPKAPARKVKGNRLQRAWRVLRGAA